MKHLHSQLSLHNSTHGDKPISTALACSSAVNNLGIKNVEIVFQNNE